MGNSEELLIGISSKLYKIEQELKDLYQVSEYNAKRKQYDRFIGQVQEMKECIVQDLAEVKELETYTGTNDRI